jgi:UPF0042 nucleotide-binding protein
MSQADASDFLERVSGLLGFLLPCYEKEGKAYMSVAVGCTGGKHRSVVIAEELATVIRGLGYDAAAFHRDVER